MMFVHKFNSPVILPQSRRNSLFSSCARKGLLEGDPSPADVRLRRSGSPSVRFHPSASTFFECVVCGDVVATHNGATQSQAVSPGRSIWPTPRRPQVPCTHPDQDLVYTGVRHLPAT